jgi:hypothetical protein
MTHSTIQHSNHQVVEVEIDGYCNWDIDYVGLVYSRARRKRIFISYSSDDARVAMRLESALATLGLSVWIDRKELNIGDSLMQAIQDAIDNVDYVVALLSKSSVASSWVQKELEIAMNREIAGRKTVVLPVILDDCIVPGFLRGKIYRNFFAPRRYRPIAEEIAKRFR